jgi:hypothetical protein
MEQQNTLDTVDPKYQRTIIYGIICMITGQIYVGSTVQTLKERIRLHIQRRGCRAVQILDRGNYKAYEIQKWPCNTLREKLTLEGGWQRAYKASFGDFLVNGRIEGVFSSETPEASKAYGKQYREEHKEASKAYGQQYREEHREASKAYGQQYREEHKEASKAYGKQYREEHREEAKARDKQYREEHKEERKAYDKQHAKQPWTCEWCNKQMTTGARAKHKKRCKFKPVVHDGEKGC